MIDNAKIRNFKSYPELIMKSVENCCQQSTHLFFFMDAKIIVETYQKMRDADEFLKSYYSNIVLNAEIYFQISQPACPLLAKTLGANYFVKSVYIFSTLDVW